MEKKILFALDIGTRSIVGLVGEQIGHKIRLLAATRLEHNTRSMLDGQIHDVPEVAEVVMAVKSKLEKSHGPLKVAAVAAAGRALCTLRTSSELEVQTRGYLTLNEERSLELMAIQAAQKQLATSHVVNNPASYYCVGHSIVSYSLDGTPMKTLVGQRGQKANIELIATFLPRQVIDSLHAAVQTAGMEIGTLTLEPIAAINVLIPPTMRHLNLALVDVGAGTSDVAITRDGAVIGYGMVPFAGDEVTEAISDKYLLDFKVAETLKRKLGSRVKTVMYTDILGVKNKAAPEAIIQGITSVVTELAKSIASQILLLNNTAPQAILLVGGGSLTPLLPEMLAEVMGMQRERVAVRRPDAIEDITDIPADFCTPDSVTPLGILKLAGSHTLNFLNVTLNNQPLRLFNLGGLTVGDALLAAGVDARTLTGRPGLGITVTINGETQFLAGSHGNAGQIAINGKKATFSDPVNEDDIITVSKGVPGASPNPAVKDMVDLPEPFSLKIEGKSKKIGPVITINGQPGSPSQKLADRDNLVWHPASTLDYALLAAGIIIEPTRYVYQVNEVERIHSVWPKFQLNGQLAEATAPVTTGDSISIIPSELPSLSEVVGFTEADADPITIVFNGSPCYVPTKRWKATVNGNSATLTAIVPNQSVIDFQVVAESSPTLAETLLAAEFDPRDLPFKGTIHVLLNGKITEYTSRVKNNDKVDILIK